MKIEIDEDLINKVRVRLAEEANEDSKLKSDLYNEEFAEQYICSLLRYVLGDTEEDDTFEFSEEFGISYESLLHVLVESHNLAFYVDPATGLHSPTEEESEAAVEWLSKLFNNALDVEDELEALDPDIITDPEPSDEEAEDDSPVFSELTNIAGIISDIHHSIE